MRWFANRRPDKVVPFLRHTAVDSRLRESIVEATHVRLICVRLICVKFQKGLDVLSHISILALTAENFIVLIHRPVDSRNNSACYFRQCIKCLEETGIHEPTASSFTAMLLRDIREKINNWNTSLCRCRDPGEALSGIVPAGNFHGFLDN